jgi:hypothetical protein
VDPHVYGTEAHLRENLAHFGMSEIVRPIVAPSVTAAGEWTATTSSRASKPTSMPGCRS